MAFVQLGVFRQKPRRGVLPPIFSDRLLRHMGPTIGMKKRLLPGVYTGMIRAKHPGVWVPADGMGGLFGDILTNIKTAAVKAVGEGITKAKADLTKTIQKEAAEGATKVVTKLIAPKTTTPTATVTPQVPVSTEAPVVTTQHPAFQPSVQQTPVYLPADPIKKYAPYAIAAAGGVALLVMLARRK